MDLTRVIIKPYNTEKSYLMSLNEQKKYAFVVNRSATKELISQAFTVIYGVNPEKINVVNKKPTAIRTGTRVPGMTKAMKIAYITLPKGLDIAVDEEQEQSTEEKK